LPLCREGGRLPPGLWEKAAAPVLTLIPQTLGCATRLRPTTRSSPPGLPLCFFLCHRVTGTRPPDPCATRTTPASSTRRPGPFHTPRSTRKGHPQCVEPSLP